MRIGNHVNTKYFELVDMPDTNIDGYLPIEWLKNHHPDIEWEQSSLKWWSDHHKTNCVIGKKGMKFVSCEELLAENVDNIKYLGSVNYTRKDGKDITLSLLAEYKDYTDIFGQEKITSLQQPSEFDNCIEFEPGAQPSSGPIYPLFKK